MRTRAYCAHSSIRDHWALRCMSRCPDQVIHLKLDPQCLSPKANLELIYRSTAVGTKALKCADLCNPCRPWGISQRWSYQVCQEFYWQGAYERQLRLPVTPTFDCSRTKVAKIQPDFFQFVVSPLFETWDHFLKTPLSHELLESLQHT
ncbi:cAMP-specific 3',5'-cyclic phosphodiesterase 7B [Trichonephila clavipes]|nr:cAMP-specific 3',5'-cyclic phosphodiesterase 7B [Trichonephila clavipes]